MTVELVSVEVKSAREKIKEANGRWDEKRTRRELIDPILKALGWLQDTPDQRSQKEFPRGNGSVDYAFFNAGPQTSRVPILIIEAKRLNWYPRYQPPSRRVFPSGHLPETQLCLYALSNPPMRKGMAVLTTGRNWTLFDVSKATKHGTEWQLEKELSVDIVDDEQEAAQKLHEWLNRERWR